MTQTDTSNAYAVARTVDGSTLRVHLAHLLVGRELTTDEALAVAAWLVCLADPHAIEPDSRWRQILDTVRST